MLKAEKIESGYAESKVLFGLDLEIPEKNVVSLIGRNGMGKTTTVRTLMGMLPLQAGTITFDGQVVNGFRPHKIARLGCGLVPEGRHVFPSLTVYENLFATARNDHQGPWSLETVYELFPRLHERRNQSARTLSGGEQQMLAIGRALMTNPRLLILDEATEGLAPVIRQEIWACLRRLKEQGQTILLIDKNLKEMHDLVDRHYMIEKGRIVWNGSSDELMSQPELVDQYLGV
tara:strand:+ start:27126 stop:27821 length:696 start_codon:yes stop_codon:yes gene_type:complete